MQVNYYNHDKNISFGLIKLAPKDLIQSERILKRVAEPGLTLEKRNVYALDLYKIFVPYLKQEAKSKAKSSYILEEVFSDIKVKFWEFIDEANNKNVIKDLISKIDEYKPSKLLVKLKCAEQSLDEPLPYRKNTTLSERVTEKQLPVPQSEVELEDIKQKLEAEISSTKMTRTSRIRLRRRSRGLSYHKIAEKEGVGVATVRKSVKKSILKIQERNNSISEENKQLISNLAQLLNTSFEKVLKMVMSHIQVLSSSPLVIINNIKILTKDLKITKAQFVKIALKQPILLYQKPETIRSNIDASAKILGISREEFIQFGLKIPQLFSRSPQTIKDNIITAAKLFGTSKAEYTKAILKNLRILSQKPETLNSNVEACAELFGISKESFVKAALEHPALFYQKPQTIKKNIENAAKVFKISKEKYIAAALKKPQLFSSSPETLKRRVGSVAKKLKISKEEFIKAALRRPQLFSMKPETINNNVRTSAKLLRIKKSDYTRAALEQPQLFYQKPETINNNVEASAKVLGISKSAFIEMALKQPTLFYKKPETISKKARILNYYRSLKKESIKANIPARSLITSDDELYKNILVHVIQQKYFSTLTKDEIKLKMVELLDSCQNTLTVEIPNFEYSDDFIKFAENYSMELAGRNVFKFIVKE